MKIPVLLISLALSAAVKADCTSLFAAHQSADMALPYEAFDQSEGKGFRALAEAGCPAQAERLILLYLGANGGNRNDGTLWWHAAQMAASAGNYEQASQHAKKSLGESDKGPLMWNDYVLASIAFFDRDKTRLQHHRDLIAAHGRDVWGNRLNLNLLDAMLEYFDLDYDTVAKKAMERWKED